MSHMLNRVVPIGYAVRKYLQDGYTKNMFKGDLAAGLIVSLVALPLSMALAIAVGLPPQHGLYTAIAAGIIVPLIGGAPFQVTGPTAAFVVIVAPIVTKHGLRGLIITTILAGIILIATGFARLGRYINYVPYPVSTGFTSGIAVVIGTISLNDFLGLNIEKLQGEYLHKLSLIFQHIPTLYWPEALIGITSLAVMIVAPKFLPKIPSPILGIGVGTILSYILQNNGFEIATIGSRFTYTLPDGGVGHGIPPFPPSIHIPGFDSSALFAWPGMAEIHALIIPALVIATLGALESLLSATVADSMASTKHNPNSELVGIGVGNILSGLVTGIPATGAIARTATNIHSGAKTPLASIIHAILLMLYVIIFAPYMSYMPMASLAALLLTVAYRMSHWRQFIRTIKIAPRSDTIVLLACFGFTVIIDMVAGVTVGIILACFLLVKRIATLTQTQLSHSSTGYYHNIKNLKLPDDVMIYHISGSLFFGTIDSAFDRTAFIIDNIRTLIIDMEKVPFIDMTGLVAMKTMILDMHAKNRKIILCGSDEIMDKILQKLSLEEVQNINVVSSVNEAVKLVSKKKKRQG